MPIYGTPIRSRRFHPVRPQAGRLWYLEHRPWPEPDMNSVYTFAVHRGRLFAGGRVRQGLPGPTARVLVSEDGVSWSTVNVGFQSSDNEVRRLWSSTNGYLYAATQSGTPRLYRSPDGLANWEQLVGGLASTDAYVRWIEEYAGSLFLGINTDTGVAARVLRTALPAGTPPWEEVWLAPNTAIDAVNSLYAGHGWIMVTTNRAGDGDPGGIFASQTGAAASFSKRNSAQFGAGTNIVHSLIEWRGSLWCGTQNVTLGGAIWRSDDLAQTWTKVTADGFGLGLHVEEVYRLFVWRDLLLAGAFARDGRGGSLWVSDDGQRFDRIGPFGLDLRGVDAQGIFDFCPFRGALHTSSRLTSTSDPGVTRHTRIFVED